MNFDINVGSNISLLTQLQTNAALLPSHLLTCWHKLLRDMTSLDEDARSGARTLSRVTLLLIKEAGDGPDARQIQEGARRADHESAAAAALCFGPVRCQPAAL